MTLQRPGNLTQRLVESLGVRIVTGAYSAPRQFPIEADLCKEFGASRSVLREAVKMLTAKGLISSRTRRGTTVEPETRWNLLDPDVLRWLLERRFSLDLLEEFTQMRIAIEPRAATLAAQRADAMSIEKIATALARMQAAEHGDGDTLAADKSFHLAILEASGNRFYRELGELVTTALQFSIPLTNRSKGVPGANIADHRRIYKAIADGKGDAAARASHNLLQEVLQLIEDARHEKAAKK